jgi:hypothetical protein
MAQDSQHDTDLFTQTILAAKRILLENDVDQRVCVLAMFSAPDLKRDGSVGRERLFT